MSESKYKGLCRGGPHANKLMTARHGVVVIATPVTLGTLSLGTAPQTPTLMPTSIGRYVFEDNGWRWEPAPCQ